MTGLYFSGTGNSKYCVERFLYHYDNRCGTSSHAFSIEEKDAAGNTREARSLVIGYPVQYSNIPKILKDFIITHKNIWQGKKVFIIATMGLFSGDGAGMLARLLKKHGASVTGGLHLKMPDSICDEKALKRSLQDNKKLVANADLKIKKTAYNFINGNPPQEGLSFPSHLAGLFGQRLYFYGKTQKYSSQLKINKSRCTGCGKCANICPMKNIQIYQKKAIPKKQCTMCYRCISQCPAQAITLLGRQVIEQSYIGKYL